MATCIIVYDSSGARCMPGVGCRVLSGPHAGGLPMAASLLRSEGEHCSTMTQYAIPFNKPGLAGNEFRYMAAAVAAGHLSGDGPFTQPCHALLEEVLGAAKVLLTTSCTHALEMAALLLDLHPGDEVIVPSFTFVSTANAFVLRGARPVFADIRPDTLNLDETRLAALITPRTRAVFPVHYAGVGCERDAILEIAAQHGLAVVEDNAHGLFGKYNGRYLGTFGGLATQSFHETKNFTCGEGGALIINDPQYIERAEILREKGTNRSRSPPSCTPSLRHGSRSRPGAERSGNITLRTWPVGRRRMGCGCRWCPAT